MYLDRFDWARLASASVADPLRIMTSACLLGEKTGWEGTAYTDDLVVRLARNPRVRATGFCPEAVHLSVPRPLTTIHGGDGFAVLDGEARVLDTTGRDCTMEILDGAARMCELAHRDKVELCVMLDVSDTCGSNVIYLGRPEDKRYQQGAGVAVAMLVREGFSVISQRDLRTLGKIVSALDGAYETPADAIDFVESDWYRAYFKQ